MKMCAPGAHSIIFSHGIEVWTPLSRLRRWSLRRSDLVVAPSEDTARHLAEQQGVRKENIRKLAWSLGPELISDVVHGAPIRAPEEFPPGRIDHSDRRSLGCSQMKRTRARTT